MTVAKPSYHACRRLTIFEGPDGSGKTSAAYSFAAMTGALYLHHGPYPAITSEEALVRMYVETMLPALHGLIDVVMDRCWLSELPYGLTHRGQTRLTMAGQAILDRLAMKCNTVIVHCRPPWEVIQKNFSQTDRDEYLKKIEELREVYTIYGKLEKETALPIYTYDFSKHVAAPSIAALQPLRTIPHPALYHTAGNWLAPTVLVGETFGDHHDQASQYRWPFGSLRNSSRWLTEQLVNRGISENKLLWMNADMLNKNLYNQLVAHQPTRRFIALGNVAFDKLESLNVPNVVKVPHPQYWKRFHTNEAYELLKVIG